MPTNHLRTHVPVGAALGTDYEHDVSLPPKAHATGNRSDVLIAVSTSLDSINSVKVLSNARLMGLECFALTGSNRNPALDMTDVVAVIPSKKANLMQQTHWALHWLPFAEAASLSCGPEVRVSGKEKNDAGQG